MIKEAQNPRKKALTVDGVRLNFSARIVVSDLNIIYVFPVLNPLAIDYLEWSCHRQGTDYE